MDKEKLALLDTSGISPLVKEFADFLKAELKGQDPALEAFIESYEIYQAGLKREDEPIITSICIGPSGVGKTLLAETAALYLFGDRYGFTKIECASFAERHEYAKLIGSPAGYVGYDDEPMLSQKNIDKHHYEAILRKTGYREVLLAVHSRMDERKRLKKLQAKLNEHRFQLFNPPQGMQQTNSKYKEATEALVRLETRLKNLESEIDKLLEEANRLEKQYGDMEYHEDQEYLSVILFDEVEKANTSLHNLMLEIMDKARISLNNGQATRFNNSFIILTSNKGSREMSELLEGRGGRMGFVISDDLKRDPVLSPIEKKEKIYQKLHESATAALKEGFAPEFLARLDNVLVFQPLDRKDLEEILELRLRDLGILLNERQKPIQINIDEAVKQYFIDQALQYRTEGARALKKQIKQHLTLNIAKFFNKKTISVGDRVIVKLDSQKLLFYKDIGTSGNKDIIKRPVS